MIYRIIFSLLITVSAGAGPVPGADEQLRDLATRAMSQLTHEIRWEAFWFSRPPPSDYRAGDEIEIEFFFPESRDAVGFCSSVFGWCSLYMEWDDGELYDRGGERFDEKCERQCRVRLFQEMYVRAPRPQDISSSTLKGYEPKYFDPNNFSVPGRREVAEEKRPSFDLSLIVSWGLPPVSEPPTPQAGKLPGSYPQLRKVVENYIQSNLGGPCGDIARASIPYYVGADRRIYGRYQFESPCEDRVALFSYYSGYWGISYDINDPAGVCT